MPGALPKRGGILAHLVVALTFSLIALGAIWYGFSAEDFQRKWRDIPDQASGRMTLRLILKPTMAAVAATSDRIQDAGLGRPTAQGQDKRRSRL